MSLTVWRALLIVFCGGTVSAALYFRAARLLERRDRQISGAIAVTMLALAAATYFLESDVIECHDTGGGHIAASQRVRLWFSPGGTVVVNHASRAVRIETVYYGLPAGSVVPGPLEVPATSELRFDGDIEHVGPFDTPPSEVSAEQPYDARHWLTW